MEKNLVHECQENPNLPCPACLVAEKVNQVEATFDREEIRQHPEKLWAVIDADLQEITRDKRGIIDLYESAYDAKQAKDAYDNGPGRNAGFYAVEVTITWKRSI